MVSLKRCKQSQYGSMRFYDFHNPNSLLTLMLNCLGFHKPTDFSEIPFPFTLQSCLVKLLKVILKEQENLDNICPLTLEKAEVSLPLQGLRKVQIQ